MGIRQARKSHHGGSAKVDASRNFASSVRFIPLVAWKIPGLLLMKSKLALIGVVSLTFVACDKKEEVTESAKPGVPKTKVVRTEHLPTPKPVAPPAEPEIAQTSAVAPQVISPPPVAAPEPATPPVPQSATGKTTEELRAERLERMAKAREERTAQMTQQLATRFKEQDANGDGLLAKAETSDRMQRRFDQADKNADGYLDASEQEAMIQASAQRASEGGGQRRNRQGGNRNP